MFHLSEKLYIINSLIKVSILKHPLQAQVHSKTIAIMKSLIIFTLSLKLQNLPYLSDC